ncbi:Serine/threonine-protein kinase Tel1 [Mycena kentingensis (nom. inval.)]|nr:Serine/threonine-protein kinase Tel1 [Mycena kentingensis (nom. inval.)]
MPRILDNALGAVGRTPLVRLDKVSKQLGLKCNLLAKLEFLSAGGSIKDRIAKAMVEAAEKEGKLHPGSVVIEPTSGNTGIGLAMACAIKVKLLSRGGVGTEYCSAQGYRCIITLPDKMSLEKEATLRALGAEVIRTPTAAAWDSPESHIGVAKKLEQAIPGGIILDQYRNLNNPLIHELTTGPEIVDAVVETPSSAEHPSSGKVDVIVAGAGTGGTITGVSRVLKKHNADCIVVGVDPKGSILAVPESLNAQDNGKPYVVEGIGYDFVPDVLNRADVDEWVKTGDDESFEAVRVLMRSEGLLVGGSSGSALSGAQKWFTTEAGQKVAQTEGMNVVLVLADGIRNYMSKPWFLSLNEHAEDGNDLAKRIAEALKV